MQFKPKPILKRHEQVNFDFHFSKPHFNTTFQENINFSPTRNLPALLCMSPYHVAALLGHSAQVCWCQTRSLNCLVCNSWQTTGPPISILQHSPHLQPGSRHDSWNAKIFYHMKWKILLSSLILIFWFTSFLWRNLMKHSCCCCFSFFYYLYVSTFLKGDGVKSSHDF